jgi:hypothetical protein
MAKDSSTDSIFGAMPTLPDTPPKYPVPATIAVTP